MSEEWRGLVAAGLTKRHDATLQRGVTWWLAFKVAVLEQQSVASGLDESKFRERAVAHLKRKGPTSLRGVSATSRRLRSDCVNVWLHYYRLLCMADSPLQVTRDPLRGIGLCARHPIRASELARCSEGYLCEVSAFDFKELLNQRYSSLLAPNYIVFGPVALFNHNCGAELCFSPPLWRAPEGLFCGFRALRLDCEHDETVVAPNEEVLVNYMLVKTRQCGHPNACQCFH